MGDWAGGVAVEPLLAEVTVASVRVVAALKTDAPAALPGQVVQLQVEAALARVKVAVACWSSVQVHKGQFTYNYTSIIYKK